MFRNRVFSVTAAILFGTSLALAQSQGAGSQQSGQQQPSSQSTPRPTTQAPAQSSTANLQSPVRGQLVSVDTDEETFIITLEQAGAAGSSAPGSAGSGSAAARPSGSTQPGSAQSGSAQSGSAQPSPAGSAAQSSAARPGAAMAANQVEFKYDDDTAVTGAERGIAGLSQMKASRVTVHFVRESGEMKATRIEVMPATGAASPSSSTPGSSSSPGSTTPRPQSNPNPDTPRPTEPRQ